MNVLVLIPYQYDTVPGQRFRIEQWARLLESSGVRFRFVPFESPELKRLWYARGRYGAKAWELLRAMRRRIALVAGVRHGAWDAVVLFRELLPIGPALLERWLARKGLPILYDFDDAIFLPNGSEANRHAQWLKWPRKTGAICRLSAHTVVGNGYLAGYARRFTERVTVIPTTIDTARYLPRTDWQLHGDPVIGWSGSLTTVAHLRGLEPALKRLYRQRRFQLRVIGDASYRLEGVEVISRPWQAAAEVEQLQAFDIGVMPLPDTEWARGKCGLKLLQYMAVGVPTVSSPVGVNAAIVVDGVNGFLASSEREWVDKLTRLMTDAALRQQFAREGRRTVEERYAAKVQAPRFHQVLEAAAHRPQARRAGPLQSPAQPVEAA